MASQYAGWAISVEKFFAMGSLPLRAHARVEKELFEKLGYEEERDHGVLVLEGGCFDGRGGGWVAKKARLSPRSSLRHRADREPGWRRSNLGANSRDGCTR